MQGIIDIGNTNFKVATFKERELIQVESYPNKELNHLSTICSRFKQSALSSVVDLNSSILSSLHNVLVLNSETSLPIQLKYSTPNTLGNDRIANAIGASALYPNQNCLVIDAGTCITYDFINKKKVFLGGSISPGIRMRYKAMNNFTAKLPLLNIPQNNVNTIGDSTDTCIHSGVINGVKFEIEGFINNYRQLFSPLNVVLTGGDSNYLKNIDFSQKNSIFADQFLTLKGLNEILLFNS